MSTINDLFKHNIPFHLVHNEYFDIKHNMWVNYASNLLSPCYTNNESTMKSLKPLMYYIASKYRKNKYNIEYEVSFLVTEVFPRDNTINIIGNYGISCYPRDTTIDLGKENLSHTEEDEGKTLLYPFHISILTNVRYINKFDDKNLSFLKYKTPFLLPN